VLARGPLRARPERCTPSDPGATITGMSVETLAGVIAAVAAAASLYYARDTVRESVAGREDADRHHAEQVAEMRAATAAAAEQHRIEMADRRQVAVADTLERQLRQLAVLTEMALEVGVTARADPRLRTVGPDIPVNGNAQVPSMLIALESALAVLIALGVPKPTETAELTQVGRNAGTPIQSVASMSVGALLELQRLTLDVSEGRVGALADATRS
jgi:hypothetical protein